MTKRSRRRVGVIRLGLACACVVRTLRDASKSLLQIAALLEGLLDEDELSTCQKRPLRCSRHCEKALSKSKSKS